MSLRNENRGPKRLYHSFGFAVGGVWQCVLREQNFRLHIVAAATVLWLGRHFALSATEFAVLWVTIGLVLALEAVNTALEAAVDLYSPLRHPLAKLAKDCAAGGVLLGALASVGVALCLFGDWPTWAALLTELFGLLSHPTGWLVAAFSVVLLWLFVFVGPAGLLKESIQTTQGHGRS